jgi:O-antigen/teichoic acid export membrane protein
LFAFAAIIGVSFFSELIINILYGETYLPAAPVLSIHIWSALFVFLGVLATRWLIIEKLQFYSTLITAVGAIINISLNFILIPKIGIVGASWSTLVAYAFSGFICFSFFKPTRKYFMLQIKSVVNPSFGSFNA